MTPDNDEPAEPEARDDSALDTLDGTVLPVGNSHAVVITSSDALDLTQVGRVTGLLTPGALSAAVTTAGLLSEGITMPARLAGRLVELDSKTIAMLRTTRQHVEPGGWVQGTLRVDGKYARVARFRPAAVKDVVSGAANMVGTVAAQAQLAAIHRDVLRTLKQAQAISGGSGPGLIDSLPVGLRSRWKDLCHAESVPDGVPS